MKTTKLHLFVLFLMLFCMFANSANAVTLTAGSATAIRRGDPISILINVDESAQIAGAVFSISYDSDDLLLNSIGSIFFNESDWNDVSGTIMFCGAKQAPSGSGFTTLLSLNFTVTATAEYDSSINLAMSNINNTQAGYSSSGDDVQVLTGANNLNPDLTAAYPELLPLTLESGLISIDQDGDGLTDTEEDALGTLINNPDTDGDGMDDKWEDDNKPYTNPLDPDDGMDDPDNDGYSNLREYLAGTLPGDGGSAPSGVLADPDGDLDCDGEDMAVLVDEFGRTDCSEATPCYADLNNDGAVDETDLFLFTEDFGSN